MRAATTTQQPKPRKASKYRCGACSMPIPHWGRTLRWVDGLRRSVGKCCALKKTR